MEISGNILLFQVSWSEVVIMRWEYKGTGTKEVIRKVTARKQYRADTTKRGRYKRPKQSQLLLVDDKYTLALAMEEEFSQLFLSTLTHS